MAKDQNAEVLVVGGGPAGISTALSLAGRGKSVLLLDRSCYEQRRIGETFPPGINRELARLGLLDPLSKVPRASSAGIRTTWGGPDPFDRSFLFDPYGEGWHVDRRAFDAALAASAKERGVRISLNTTLLDLSRSQTGEWTV